MQSQLSLYKSLFKIYLLKNGRYRTDLLREYIRQSETINRHFYKIIENQITEIGRKRCLCFNKVDVFVIEDRTPEECILRIDIFFNLPSTLSDDEFRLIASNLKLRIMEKPIMITLDDNKYYLQFEF